MVPAIDALLSRFKTTSVEEFEQALREVIQDIALLGMWRSKFFEHGAFYGGTALRLLHGLDRFSEDLDFTLIHKNPRFDFKPYEGALTRELQAFGFDVETKIKKKSIDTAIHSAFLKANTKVHLIKVNHPHTTHADKVVKVKIEIDSDPASGFNLDEVAMIHPIPFTVRTLDLPSLFAGKVAAALFRDYKFNVKGRDWYDFLWYCSRKTPINLKYFTSMARQSGGFSEDRDIDIKDLRVLLCRRIDSLDIAKALRDVERFVINPSVLDGWNKDVFLKCANQITAF